MSYIKNHNEGLQILTLEGYEAGNILRILRDYERTLDGYSEVHHIIVDLAMVKPQGHDDSEPTPQELEDRL